MRSYEWQCESANCEFIIREFAVSQKFSFLQNKEPCRDRLSVWILTVRQGFERKDYWLTTAPASCQRIERRSIIFLLLFCLRPEPSKLGLPGPTTHDQVDDIKVFCPLFLGMQSGARIILFTPFHSIGFPSILQDAISLNGNACRKNGSKRQNF